jgi:hypothetical protein
MDRINTSLKSGVILMEEYLSCNDGIILMKTVVHFSFLFF